MWLDVISSFHRPSLSLRSRRTRGRGTRGRGTRGTRTRKKKGGTRAPSPRPHVFFRVLVPLPLPCLRLLPRLHCKANRKEPYERVVARRQYLSSRLTELGAGGLLTTTLLWKVSSHHILETLTSTDKLLGYLAIYMLLPWGRF